MHFRYSKEVTPMEIYQARREAIEKARRVIIKVGSAVLTNASGLDYAVIDGLVEQISAWHNEGVQTVLVTSGAVAAGRAVMRARPAQAAPVLHGVAIPEKQAAAAIGQSRLMQYYDQAFSASGKVTAQLLLTSDDLRYRQRFLHARNTFFTLLGWGVIPIVNENDTVAVDELKFGDNDTLASFLINLAEADLFINLTSAPGVFKENPGKNATPGIMPYIPNIFSLDIDALCGEKTDSGTGGMASKLAAARRVARLGVPTLILPGREKDVLTRARKGEELGTWVVAGEKSLSSRKFWLAYNEKSQGSLVVDDGAAKALLYDGKSLLPVGVVETRGSFQAGALVRILDRADKELGVGICNYPSDALQRIMGLKLTVLAETYGINHDEVIHRNNMMLNTVPIEIEGETHE